MAPDAELPPEPLEDAVLLDVLDPDEEELVSTAEDEDDEARGDTAEEDERQRRRFLAQLARIRRLAEEHARGDRRRRGPARRRGGKAVTSRAALEEKLVKAFRALGLNRREIAQISSDL